MPIMVNEPSIEIGLKCLGAERVKKTGVETVIGEVSCIHLIIFKNTDDLVRGV